MSHTESITLSRKAVHDISKTIFKKDWIWEDTTVKYTPPNIESSTYPQCVTEQHYQLLNIQHHLWLLTQGLPIWNKQFIINLIYVLLLVNTKNTSDMSTLLTSKNHLLRWRIINLIIKLERIKSLSKKDS